MSDLNIVTGDLEALSTDVSNVATEINGVNVTTDMCRCDTLPDTSC